MTFENTNIKISPYVEIIPLNKYKQRLCMIKSLYCRDFMIIYVLAKEMLTGSSHKNSLANEVPVNFIDQKFQMHYDLNDDEFIDIRLSPPLLIPATKLKHFQIINDAYDKITTIVKQSKQGVILHTKVDSYFSSLGFEVSSYAIGIYRYQTEIYIKSKKVIEMGKTIIEFEPEEILIITKLFDNCSDKIILEGLYHKSGESKNAFLTTHVS